MGTSTLAPERTRVSGATIRAAARRASSPHGGLLALTLLAAAVRFATLGGQSLWLDESYTLGNLHIESLPAMLAWIRGHEMTPPLYFLLARAWTSVFGTGAVGLRSLSALLGVGTVPLAYFAGSALRSRRLGLIAAAFVALNPLLIWYSQEGRPYALLVFLAALSFLGLVRLLRGGGTIWLAVWGVAAALLLGSHYFAVFLVAGEALLLLVRARSPGVIGVIATLAVLELLLLPDALGASGEVGFGPIGQIPLSYRILQLPSQAFAGPLEGRLGPWPGTLVALAATAWAAAAAWRSRDRLTRRIVAIAGAVLLAGAGIPVALALVGVDYLTARYLLPALIPLILLWAAPLDLGHRRWMLAAAVCVVWALAAGEVAGDPAVQRPDWRAVARVLGRASGRRAVVAPRLGLPLRIYLTPGELGQGLGPSSLAGGSVSEVAVVGAAGEHRQGCWWGGACQLPARLLPRIAAPAPGFRLVRSASIGPLRVVLFRAPAQRAIALHPARLYRGHAGLGLFEFVQPPGPVATG